MTPQEIHNRLSQKLTTTLEWQDQGPGDKSAMVPSSQWADVCSLLRSDSDLSFDFLRSLSGVDRPDKQSIEIVAHLLSYHHRHELVIKTTVDRSSPNLQTIQQIWPAANWYERELFDLFGVSFDGHPDLRRILLPEDWVGHPLRKDYQEASCYQNIPTSRPGYEKSRESE